MLAEPLQIGPLRLATNLLLAPIAGYCDLAFRTIVREWSTHPAGIGVGVGLACTDLLSPQGLLRGTATSLDLAATNDFDKPVGMQLYGSDPDIMAQGARWAVEHGATVVDINMGCPVDKVTKKDGGSKLLTDLGRAVEIARRVVAELEMCALSADEWQRRTGNSSFPVPVERAPVPLTCKMRLCWHDSDYASGNACSPHLARMLADVGVTAVTVHGRTTEMKFSGEVQLPGIARVVEAVGEQIPVIGNGDVREPEDAVRMIRATGCQGVMIGRGALSTPWIFRDAWALQKTGKLPQAPGEAEIVASIRRYLDLMIETRGVNYAMVQIRRRITWFAKRMMWTDERGRLVGVKPLKEAVRNARSPSEVHQRLDEYLAGGLRGGSYEAEEATA
ncbi:MAG: tRNA-dihydrouridine synthase [Phycisphaerales bacterium]|nr:tRNA-dihydrouridine synthase [Planctomycetota bacterium]